MRLENSFIVVEGVGETTERNLWREGVTHWDDAVECSFVGDTIRDRIRTFAERAREELDAGNAAFFEERLPGRERWRLAEDFRRRACYFDIETTGLDRYRDDVTTVSLHRAGETTTLVSGDDLTRDRLASEFSKASFLVSFNGVRFDAPFLRHQFDLAIDVPHLDLMYPLKRLGLSGGLKRIEADLGLERDLPDVDGLEAVRLWHRYERGDDDALERLVRYNREDARNLETLLDIVARELDERVFRAHVPRSDPE